MKLDFLNNRQYDSGEIAAGLSNTASQINNFGSALAQAKLNHDTQSYNIGMYKLQRADALSDWNMQNQYNSPTSQMQRLKAAGLNPNLVYGHGADTTSGPVRSSSENAWNPTAPNYKGMGTLEQYFNTRMQQAQTDNLKAQNTVLVEDAMLKAAQRGNTEQSTITNQAYANKIGIDTAAAALQLGLDQSTIGNKMELSKYSVDAAKANLEKTGAETTSILDNNDRQNMMMAPNFQLGVLKVIQARLDLQQSRLNQAKTSAETSQINQNIDNLKQALQNAKDDDELKKAEINLNDKGIQKGDNMFFRMGAQFLSKYGIGTNAEAPKTGSFFGPEDTSKLKRDKNGTWYRPEDY